MTGQVRVLLYHRAHERCTIEAAYRRVSRALAGTPGLVGNQLLGSVQDPTEYLVISDWTDLEAFERWERGAGHQDSTADLRPYRDLQRARPFGVFRVDAEFRTDGVAADRGVSDDRGR